MVKIITLNNEVESYFLEEILKEKKIPYVLKKFYDTAYNGIFEMQLGWGMIMAFEEDREKIIKHYDDVKMSIIKKEKNNKEKINDDSFREINNASKKIKFIITILIIIILTIILVLYNYNYQVKHKEKKINYMISIDKSCQV